MKVVLDSSGWIELLVDHGRGGLFEPALYSEELIVPAMVYYEVTRYVLAFGGKQEKERVQAALGKFTQAQIDQKTADLAASLAHQHKLSAADAIIYATSQYFDAELWTQDAHFAVLPMVKYFKK